MNKMIAAVMLALPMGAHAQNISDEIDKFTGQRILGYTSSAKVILGKPVAGFFIRQGGDTPISGVRFMISPELGRYSIQTAKYIGCRTVEWLVDGKPQKLGTVAHDLKRFDRTLIEFVIQEASIDQIAAIGDAQSVEYRMCGTEGALAQEDIAAAKKIAALANEKNAPAEQPRDAQETPRK